MYLLAILTFLLCDFGNSQQISQIHKAVLTQKGYIQFLKYKVDVPPLSQFTFCLWLKSYNLTHSHPIVSYSQHERDRLLRVWLSPGGRWLKVKLLEQDISATRVDIRENKWIHICHSWHSLTAKWQLYLDGQLRAQGTAEKLRDIIVPGGGDLVVGQEYTDFNKGLDDGIEGEVFGFNMVLSSTTEAGNHRYFHRQESRDNFQTLSPEGDLPDIHNDYIRLADIEDKRKTRRPHEEEDRERFQPRRPEVNLEYRKPQQLQFEQQDYRDQDNQDHVLDIEQHADAPVEISHAPPLPPHKHPGDVLKPPSTFSSQWSSYLPPPSPEEPPVHSTYEAEYSKRNFKGNEWYDQNRYFPKELLKQNSKHRHHHHHHGKYGKGKKSQTQKEISLIETSELYPYPSENDYVYVREIPGVPIERSHTVAKRELVTGEKNIQILNPESVILYPRKSDVVNVVIALRPDDNESVVEETRLHPRPFSLPTSEFDSKGDDSRATYEVLYAQNHYTGPNLTRNLQENGPYNVDIGGSDTEDLPRFVNQQVHNPYNVIFKKYPQSISDKLEEVENSQFRKPVKLGNALNELQIFKQHGNNRDNSFINSDNRVPDIVRYRSDIDRQEEERRLYRFNDISRRGEVQSVYQQPIAESTGRKLVELSFRKCLLGKGSPLSGDGLSLISWTLTPVKMFGGGVVKVANPACGLF